MQCAQGIQRYRGRDIPKLLGLEETEHGLRTNISSVFEAIFSSLIKIQLHHFSPMLPISSASILLKFPGLLFFNSIATYICRNINTTCESGQCCLHVQDFRAEHLVLGNQLGGLSLGKVTSSILSILGWPVVLCLWWCPVRFPPSV